jgi:FMN-dependent NADH-azoreductase
MAKLLRIDSSSRMKNSHSREIADLIQTKWSDKNKNGEIVIRDLVSDPIPHINDLTISAFYSSEKDHNLDQKDSVQLSNTLINELQSSDDLLISAPMYNFSIPSALKAYIDQVVRIGYTFNFDEKGFSGLVNGKRAFVVNSYGAVYSDEFKSFNFLEPYLKSLLLFLGFQEKDIHFISIEGTTINEDILKQTKEKAQAEIASLFN